MKNWRERIDELKFYTGSRWLADMWQKQKDETTIEIDLPTHSKEELKEIIDEILDQRTHEIIEEIEEMDTYRGVIYEGVLIRKQDLINLIKQKYVKRHT